MSIIDIIHFMLHLDNFAYIFLRHPGIVHWENEYNLAQIFRIYCSLGKEVQSCANLVHNCTLGKEVQSCTSLMHILRLGKEV